ncbi:MAG: glycosyltransferase family 2 protein [Anaerolineae bacterium]|nr:glycosyltransferase family 2 protein [Anaerolineae bacterium]
MTDNPLVSVVVPVYNCERYLPEALESVLAQTYRPIEIIVVDDGSTDGSADAAQRLGPTVRYCWQSHSGASAARNRGVDLAKGGFLAFLDADDLWLEAKLALQLAAFEADPTLDIVFGHVQQFPSPDLEDSAKVRLRYSAEKLPGHVPSTMLITREAFLRVGPFESHWRLGEFMDWYLRALERGPKTLMLPDVLARRRLHADNLGVRERDSQGDYLRILKASLDRRRGSAPGPEDAREPKDES